MRLLLAGASGLIGTALRGACESAGDDVRVLVRRSPRTEHEVQWQPESGQLDPAALREVDAVICLSGAGAGDHRWTDSYRRTIMTSRTSSVGTLARAIAASDNPPAVFISASAVGYYGDTGDDPIDESAPSGNDFFAEVCRAWEAAATPAAESGTRLVQLRSGIVLARHGPVLARMLPLFRLGLGGRLGSGRQFWPWIALADEVTAIRFLLLADVIGPVNLTAPNPATNAEFTRTLATLLHRPALFAVPAFALHIALGDFAAEITGSHLVLPTKLITAGFEFSYPDLASALAAELSGSSAEK